MSINKSEVEHLAALSRLELTEEEKDRLTHELGGIVDFANKLDELDVSEINPTMHAADLFNVFREDEIRESYPTNKILQNAPESDEGCFVVPKAVE